MSGGGGDSFLARWSRRKQAVREAEAGESEAESARGRAALDTNEASADAAPAAIEPSAVEDAEASEPLPRIEELSAEGDLSAFLRKNVPAALKSAAIRKMWSLDPAIRDFVGPSEYAWDFNQPGSMPGFGPLDGKQAVVDFLSTVQNGLARAETALDPPPVEAAGGSAAPPEQEASTPADFPAAASMEDRVDPSQVAENPSAPSADAAQAAALAEASRRPETAARPRHGSALPR
jgi:hypothetical protein